MKQIKSNRKAEKHMDQICLINYDAEGRLTCYIDFPGDAISAQQARFPQRDVSVTYLPLHSLRTPARACISCISFS